MPNGVILLPAPGYSDHPVVGLSAAQERFLRDNVLREITTAVSEPDRKTARPNRFLGMRPLPHYVSYASRLLRWEQPPGMVDDSQSGWNQYLMRAFFKGDAHPTLKRALSLSSKFERYFDDHAPSHLTYERNKKSPLWHANQVINVFDALLKEGALILARAATELPGTPFEQQAAAVLRHLASDTRLSETAKVMFMHIVAQANGRDVVVLGDETLASLMNCSTRTVMRSKKALRRHSCLIVDRSKLATTYKLQLDNPCNN